ncbi:Amidohydrolase 1 [Cynara cardunculus var. scolymus]|uniref:dihydroorotase n=1 Tax=Cynara cardunculus var. scolymus TaxID=59895 RepID=A0A103XTS1_CYNCS|nr:Amidohydrolase 1 [Cynara cardunculus var. scolymus]
MLDQWQVARQRVTPNLGFPAAQSSSFSVALEWLFVRQTICSCSSVASRMIKSLVLPGKPSRLYAANIGGFEQVKSNGVRMELSIAQPDDWHLHLRDGDLLEAVISHSSKQFGRAIVMPNLKPPITTTAAAAAYRKSILKALQDNTNFTPLMTLYLTDTTTPHEIKLASLIRTAYTRCLVVSTVDSSKEWIEALIRFVGQIFDVDSVCRESGIVYAVKLYPAGATTNSQDGVTDLFGKCVPVLEEMVNQNMPLLVHGEVTDPEIDIFDRERVFIETVLKPLIQKFPKLKVVMEHVTTMDAVRFVESCEEGSVAATVTPQHLLLNRNSLFQGGLQPHSYCLPVLKRETHRQAIVSAVTSGNRRFFLGTDSAPHERRRKESVCGCAGIFNAPVALSLYAKVFEEAGALDKLEAFTSFNGPDFYGLPRNTRKMTLKKTTWKVPESYSYASGSIVPMSAGESLEWLPCLP